MKKLISVFGVITALMLVMAPVANAIIISPIAIDDIELDRGEAAFRTITVINDQEGKQTFYLSAKNFEPVGEEGEVSITHEKYGLAEWITFPGEAFTLEPGEEKEVDFSIVIPENADPGSHFAAVFVSTQAPDVEEGLGLSEHVGTLVFTRVEGDAIEDVRLLGFNTVGNKTFYNRLPTEFEYRIENRGTIHVKPKGVINLNGWFGDDEIKANPIGGRNLPNSIRRLETVWVKDPKAVEPGGFMDELKNEWKNFAIGKYTAELALAYGENDSTLSAETGFWVFPWRVFLVAGLLVIVIIALILLYNKMVISAANRKKK